MKKSLKSQDWFFLHINPLTSTFWAFYMATLQNSIFMAQGSSSWVVSISRYVLHNIPNTSLKSVPCLECTHSNMNWLNTKLNSYTDMHHNRNEMQVEPSQAIFRIHRDKIYQTKWSFSAIHISYMCENILFQKAEIICSHVLCLVYF